MKTSFLFVLSFLSLAAVAGIGCDAPDYCMPDEEGLCARPDAGRVVADASQGDAGQPGCTADDSGALGDPCTTDADCGCPADYCVLAPGAGEGYCSVTGCVEDPELCPNGYACTDLSRFSPELPSVCSPE